MTERLHALNDIWIMDWVDSLYYHLMSYFNFEIMGFGPSHVQLPSPKAGSEDGFFGRSHVESIHLSASNSLKGSVVCCSIC